MTEEEILTILKKTKWGNPSREALRPAGKSLLNWHCKRRMLRFEGFEGGLMAAGFVTIFVCAKCGHVRHENANYFGIDVEEENLFELVLVKNA